MNNGILDIANEKAIWLDNQRLEDIIATKPERSLILEILAKAKELHGLSLEEAGALMQIDDPELEEELKQTAKFIKREIYGNRIVLFAPLYISNLCSNECLYCAFRKSNGEIQRRALNMDEIANETKVLLKQGHKRVLIVAGEAYPGKSIEYILNAIDTVYSVKEGKDSIRRINVNLAPMTIEEFKELKGRNIGTFQLFQETYHRPTYLKMHLSGKKRDFDWRASSFDRAMLAGIDDVGMGLLYGLYDWKYETLALIQHIEHLEERFGVGCHTISVPRIEPATGSDLASSPPHPVSDANFLKLIAILRLTVPYTGMIMSTRESAELRGQTLELGVSQISAASRTNPGGYGEETENDPSAQFQLGDTRSLDEVICYLAEHGHIPSFCTGCYRSGRTGKDFMDLAKPGIIKRKCDPNALVTFAEYLLDHANATTKAKGEMLIKDTLARMDAKIRINAENLLGKVYEGKRDVYC